MEKMINQRNVVEHLRVIESLCRGIYLNYNNPEVMKRIIISINSETSELLTKCYFESKEKVDELESMICDILDNPDNFGCLEKVYQIYVSLLTSLVEIKNDDYLRNQKGLAVK